MRILRTLLFSLALLFTGTVFAADGPVRVVYHLVEGLAQASRAMGNIRNHLDADPTAKIVVVAHGSGIDFLLEGALDAKGQPYAGAIGDLANRGVQFRVCNNTLISRGISNDKLVLEASVVPSGVAEVARLQFKEGYAYLRP
ncbi:MAG: DsrE family protein [Burkholderiales bacterium]|nr:DsrE family protein [Burkholderiales bacterium]